MTANLCKKTLINSTVILYDNFYFYLLAGIVSFGIEILFIS